MFVIYEEVVSVLYVISDFSKPRPRKSGFIEMERRRLGNGAIIKFTRRKRIQITSQIFLISLTQLIGAKQIEEFRATQI
jgi:hypothetical protein